MEAFVRASVSDRNELAFASLLLSLKLSGVLQEIALRQLHFVPDCRSDIMITLPRSGILKSLNNTPGVQITPCYGDVFQAIVRDAGTDADISTRKLDCQATPSRGKKGIC